MNSFVLHFFFKKELEDKSVCYTYVKKGTNSAVGEQFIRKDKYITDLTSINLTEEEFQKLNKEHKLCNHIDYCAAKGDWEVMGKRWDRQ